nr:hypothetical protein [Tanacetum cinerariifolium]
LVVVLTLITSVKPSVAILRTYAQLQEPITRVVILTNPKKMIKPCGGVNEYGKRVEKSKLLTEERILVVCVEILARVSKAFVNIIDCRAALFKGADRGFHQLISLISMRNVFIVVIINGGFEAEDQRKLVKATSIIRPDPNEPVRVEFMINGKTVYLTEQEIQEY